MTQHNDTKSSPLPHSGAARKFARWVTSLVMAIDTALISALPEVSPRSKKIIKWSGTGMFAVGSVLISAFPTAMVPWFPFATFLVGHAVWLFAGLVCRDAEIVGLNGMYLPLDFYAVLIRV